MWWQFKRLARFILRWLKRAIIVSVIFGFLTYASIYTPIFSNVGLFVLNRLPVPDATKYAHPPIRLTIKDTPLDLTQATEPVAYVVLGGGLTKSDKFEEGVNTSEKSEAKKTSIVLNQYSERRVQTAHRAYEHQPLTVVLTGVEAPWMRDWLQQHGVFDIITENASMNTCENARFTAKRLYLGNVYLITDAYHMTRARRQFALNGIKTTPLPAPLPQAKSWQDVDANVAHSRRTIYELAAYARDVFKPQTNCRHADEVSFSTLLRSRKPDAVKTF